MTPNYFFTSDTHFFHKNVLKFCPITRPFETVDAMNEALVEKWNARVKPNDIIFNLGDFSFGKAEQTETILKRLNGNIFLVRGNHDQQFDGALKKYLTWIGDYKELRSKVLGVHIVLCHFPIESWHKMEYNSLHLHGHTHLGHNKPSHWPIREIKGRMDVGIDSRLDQSPWAWEELKEKLGV